LLKFERVDEKLDDSAFWSKIWGCSQVKNAYTSSECCLFDIYLNCFFTPSITPHLPSFVMRAYSGIFFLLIAGEGFQFE